jgi:D-glycero-D-manno-heptose 1,7-bisphosphate phosphatase
LSAPNPFPLPRGQVDAVFLDRDGTINAKAPEGCYITSPRALRLLPGAGAAVRRLNDARVPVLVVTNQRGVALGRMTLEQVAQVNDALQLRLSRIGAMVDGFYVCPHQAGACACRKPLPGLLLQASRDFPERRLPNCVIIGDSEVDVEAGLAAGCAAIRLGPPGTASIAGVLCPDLAAAVDVLLQFAATEAPTSLRGAPPSSLVT